MAAPSYGSDLTDITTSFSTGYSLITEGGGGANSLTAPETDDYIQGSSCVSRNPFSSSIRGIIYDNGSTVSVTTDDAVYYWWKADVAQALDTKAGGGVRLVMGIGTTDYNQYYVAGNDNYALGGWRCTPIDPNDAGDLDRGTPGSPPYDFYGVTFDVPSSGPSKGYPFKLDMIRHGRQVTAYDGEAANPITWDSLTSYADNSARRWGIVQGTDTGAAIQGIVQFGTTSSAYSRDSNRAIVFVDTEFTSSDFSQILFIHSSTDVVWDSMSFTALGTNNRGLIDINTTDNPSISITNSVISGINTTTGGGTNTTFDGTTWNGCNEVTSNGGSYLNCSIISPTITADSSALIYNSSNDPDGELDGMTFEKGTNAHHAIEFSTTSPTSMTLRDCDFGTGFSTSNNVNNSTFYVKRTSGTVTINLVGCTGNVSYKTDGATVVLVQDPVTLSIKAQNTSGTAISGARVLVTVADGSNFPYQDAITISKSVASNYQVGYFDGSDVPASDPDNNWTNETNTDDGDVRTIASNPIATGSSSSNYIEIQGTNISGFTQAQLDVANVDWGYQVSDGSGYTSTVIGRQIDTPTGGWTLAKIQALEARYWMTNIGTSSSEANIYEDGDAGGTGLSTGGDYSSTVGASGYYLSRVNIRVQNQAVATVVHTAHGMSEGDYVVINGANENGYNGVHQIFNVTTNGYDYFMNTDESTPATGTISATMALISGTTSGTGTISDTRTYTLDQDIEGRVRKSSGSPYYKTGDIVGTVDSTSGLSLTVVMLSDE